MSLHAFFDAMAPMLSGRTQPHDVERALGPSPSGTENLRFYATLAERNHFKILRDLFEPIRVLLMRNNPNRWGRFVRDYTRLHPAVHWDPNRFGEHFSGYLRSMREQEGEISPVLEELADFSFTRHLARTGADSAGDGFEQRLFVRQYTHPIPDFSVAFEKDNNAPLPAPQALVVLVYRHAQTHDVRLFRPSVAGLAALARRQGLDTMPEMFRALPMQTLDEAEASLIEHGVLTPESNPS